MEKFLCWVASGRLVSFHFLALHGVLRRIHSISRRSLCHFGVHTSWASCIGRCLGVSIYNQIVEHGIGISRL